MYKTSIDIEKRLHEHLLYAYNTYEKDWFVICVQGSQNYGMDDEESDLDSKVLLLPSLEDLVLNRAAISHTLEMPDNQEHVDCKDARDYFKIFRKSNINFVEILFTDYWIVNNRYSDLWLGLRRRNEELARINPYAAVSCMKGMASEKYHALCHNYPSRMHMIEKYGYDPKQLSHLARINYFIKHYVAGDAYEHCIYPQDPMIRNMLIKIKRGEMHKSVEHATAWAESLMNEIIEVADNYRNTPGVENKNNPKLDKFLNDILYKLIERNLKRELKGFD